jgi:CDP-diglyceride synthetase
MFILDYRVPIYHCNILTNWEIFQILAAFWEYMNMNFNTVILQKCKWTFPNDFIKVHFCKMTVGFLVCNFHNIEGS